MVRATHHSGHGQDHPLQWPWSEPLATLAMVKAPDHSGVMCFLYPHSGLVVLAAPQSVSSREVSLFVSQGVGVAGWGTLQLSVSLTWAQGS